MGISESRIGQIATRWHLDPSGATMPVAVGSAVDLAAFAVLVYGTELPLLAANSLGYALAAITAAVVAVYACGAGSGRTDSAIGVLLFLAINLCGLAITTLALWLGAASVPIFAAKILALTATTVWNHLGAAKFLLTR